MPVLSNKILISIIIPTLNSASVIGQCLNSIKTQNIDQSKIEIIIIDGGSTDNTLTIAQKFNCKIINNPLKTAEAGKATGIKHATGTYVALIDSDNILPTKSWLKKMLIPFSNNLVIGTEPWQYTYRPHAGYIERYSALTGVNDPYSLITNNYDRKNYIRPNWNGLNIKTKNYKNYQLFKLTSSDKIPSIGANGTIYRRSIFNSYHSDYLIDVDLLNSILVKTKELFFAKVKCGIIHSYCESSINKFIKKQNRRVIDLYIYQNQRPKHIISSQIQNNIKFSLYVVLILPMLFDTFYGYYKKPDIAWFFHPFACIITLFVYGKNTILYRLKLLKPQSRSRWSQ
ncbi:MAG: glycosyltransferase family 2 protein [Candidatus Shapirobacteria bacterium]